MDLQRGIEDADEAYQDHEARGEEVHDEFQGILEKKRPYEHLDAEDQKEKGKEGNQDVFCPPEVQIRCPY